MLRLAVIGLGSRATGLVAKMCQIEPELQLVAVADPDRDGAVARCERSDVPTGQVIFHGSTDAMLEYADRYDGVLIGTRCHLHTPMACKVAPTGLPLFLEKPVAITSCQLTDLARAFDGCEDRVIVSFPLRVTPLFREAFDIVRSGTLGTINQIQAFNNVSYGGVYFGGWYRNYNETGGLWLQKATHDFDYLTLLADARPLMVAATTTQLVYGGDMPHDLLCSACERAESGVESHINLRRRGDDGGMCILSETNDHWCAFSREIKNQDAGAALVMYENGIHVSYTQNFVSRRKAGRRGAIVTGHRATLNFDWNQDMLSVIDHDNGRVEERRVMARGDHSGGDEALCENFIQMMRGDAGPATSLHDGIRSVAMCLAARESAYHRTFEPVVLPGETRGDVSRPIPSTELPVD